MRFDSTRRRAQMTTHDGYTWRIKLNQIRIVSFNPLAIVIYRLFFASFSWRTRPEVGRRLGANRHTRFSFCGHGLLQFYSVNGKPNQKLTEIYALSSPRWNNDDDDALCSGISRGHVDDVQAPSSLSQYLLYFGAVAYLSRKGNLNISSGALEMDRQQREAQFNYKAYKWFTKWQKDCPDLARMTKAHSNM